MTLPLTTAAGDESPHDALGKPSWDSDRTISQKAEAREYADRAIKLLAKC